MNTPIDTNQPPEHSHLLLNQEAIEPTVHNGNLDTSNSNRDSGIQDGEFVEPQAHVEYPKQQTENPGPVEECGDDLSRRCSIISRHSAHTVASIPIDPRDELCGWGPFSPSVCQRFRNPKWVLVWLSLAGVCQVQSCRPL